MQKMLRGGESAFEELFAYACPKFITPAPPSLDAPSMNTNQVQLSTDVGTTMQKFQVYPWQCVLT